MVLKSLQADTDEERQRAWQFGLSSDGQQEWSRRAQELRAYQEQYGDSHIGFREDDAPELTRWAAKQRSDWRAGDLCQDRHCSCHWLPIIMHEKLEAEPVLGILRSAGPLCLLESLMQSGNLEEVGRVATACQQAAPIMKQVQGLPMLGGWSIQSRHRTAGKEII